MFVGRFVKIQQLSANRLRALDKYPHGSSSNLLAAEHGRSKLCRTDLAAVGLPRGGVLPLSSSLRDCPEPNTRAYGLQGVCNALATLHRCTPLPVGHRAGWAYSRKND